MLRRALPLLLACAYGLTAIAAVAPSGDVTIYRCTDAKGAQRLQDAPCSRNDSQQIRTMLRPKDAPSRPAPAPIVAAPAPVAPQRIVINAPRPLYECRRGDGSTYTSGSGDGNPRYLANGGYGDGDDAYSRDGLAGGAAAGSGPGVAGPRYGRGHNGNAGSGFTPVTPPLVGIPQGNSRRTLPPRPPRGGRGYPYGIGYGDSEALVRDDCSPLPQTEACDRLRDRRDDLRGRFFQVQANERATLSTEERGLNARLAQDCGGA
ncbi:MAG: hypothetical protein ACREO8_12610 [Luteimonas sp.]